jgi:hypothetical protein
MLDNFKYFCTYQTIFEYLLKVIYYNDNLDVLKRLINLRIFIYLYKPK